MWSTGQHGEVHARRPPARTARTCQRRAAGEGVRRHDAMTDRRTTATSTARRCSDGPERRGIYAWGENSPLKAYTFSQGSLQDVANAEESAFRPPHGMPGGMLALSANGTQAGTGIVWAVVPLDGDANQQRGVKGIVLALDAQDVTRTLWTSEQFVAARSARAVRQVQPADRGGRQGLRRDLRRRRAAAHLWRQRAAPDGSSRRSTTSRSTDCSLPRPRAAVVNQDRDDVTVVRAPTRRSR